MLQQVLQPPSEAPLPCKGQSTDKVGSALYSENKRTNKHYFIERNRCFQSVVFFKHTHSLHWHQAHLLVSRKHIKKCKSIFTLFDYICAIFYFKLINLPRMTYAAIHIQMLVLYITMICDNQHLLITLMTTTLKPRQIKHRLKENILCMVEIKNFII